MEIEPLSRGVDKDSDDEENVLDKTEGEVEANSLEMPDDSVDVARMDELDELPGMTIT